MSGKEIFMLVAQVLGGLALFVFGMKVMSEGLQRAAGSRVRRLLFQITRNRLAGLVAGTTLGVMVHSSATTVMVVGFINAGLLALAPSVPVILGANLGTTFSMQVVSFKLDEYCFAAIALGLLLQLVGRKETFKNIGAVVLGFGLLFLGMKTMSAGVAPLKGSGTLEAILTFTDASTFGGALLGLLISTAITGVIQSSGATIGMLFALAHAGVIRDISQAFPLVLGAHIGTCATALLGSVGTNVEARRAAIAHLAFNTLGAFLALAMMRGYLWVLPLTSDDPVRQIANAHTLVQLTNTLLLLPFTVPYARFIERIARFKGRAAEQTHLDDRYLATPEAAIVAAMRETGRMAALARRTLVDAMRGFVRLTTEPFALVQRTEQAVNELKRTVLEYLLRVAAHKLSRRQALLVQQLQSAVVDIERIGDHASLVVELVTDKVQRKIWFDDDCMNRLLELYQKAEEILRLTEQSLDPTLDKEERHELAATIIDRRDGYAEASRELREHQRQLVLEKCQDALTGMFYLRFVACLDKIVRHSKTIAFMELEPLFFLKPHKLERAAEEIPRAPVQAKVTSIADELFPPEAD